MPRATLHSLPCHYIQTTTAAHDVLQVSAEVLRHLLQLASQHLSGDIPDQVVITVPAYFDKQQRAATLEAAQLAGIKKVGNGRLPNTSLLPAAAKTVANRRGDHLWLDDTVL